MTLNELEIGQQATIMNIHGDSTLRKHLLSMGITPNVKVMMYKKAPFSNPIIIKLRGYLLSLRIQEAKNIEVQLL